MRKLLVYAVDGREHALALFSAARADRLSVPRDFDILITSLEPLGTPPDLAALGIRNEVIPVAKAMAAERLTLDWLPIVAYLRLWLPGHFAGRYDRLLYLDADTYIISADLSRLFEVDMGAHAVAAVLDKEQWFHPDRPVLDFAQRGSGVNRYLNSGVLLMDVARYNTAGLLEQMLAIHRSGEAVQHHDQSLLNLALAGQFAELSPRWNWQWTGRFPALTGLAKPLILHFGGPGKPWEAGKRPTRFPVGLIEEYRGFLNARGGPLAFQTQKRGGQRYTLLDRADNLAGHAKILRRYARLMRRAPDPFNALL